MSWLVLSLSFAGIRATVGMHPHDAKDVGADELKRLKELAADPKVVAVKGTSLKVGRQGDDRKRATVFWHIATR